MERWAEIPGYDGLYSASSSGKIRRNFINLEREIKPYVNKKGYSFIQLSKEGKVRCFCLHRLIAISFFGIPKGKKEVNHKDTNKLNNNIKNLEFVTSKQNKAHSIKHNLNANGERQHLSKLTSHNIILLRKEYSSGKITKRYLSRKYNISETSVANIINRKTWKHL